jgi:hypothetical protein
MAPAKVHELKTKATAHMNFMATIYKEQLKEGRYFLHEHPAGASSWKLDAIQKIRGSEGVVSVLGDMCAFGMTQRDKNGEGHVKKLTRFMTNAPCLAESLRRSCPGDHRHITLVDGRAKSAEVYPDGLCKAMCAGFRKQTEQDATPDDIGFGLEKKSLQDWEVQPGSSRIG